MSYLLPQHRENGAQECEDSAAGEYRGQGPVTLGSDLIWLQHYKFPIKCTEIFQGLKLALT